MVINIERFIKSNYFIVYMVLPLEERLRGLNCYHSQLVEVLSKRVIVPETGSYLKHDLAERIAGYLDRRGVSIREQDGDVSTKSRIYQTINKEPLKRVEYGILNAKGISKELFERLTEWEALYFLAGIWAKKSTKNESLRYDRGLLERQPVKLIIAETIYAGINYLGVIQRREKEKGRYKTDIKLPYAEEIKQRYFALRSRYVAERKALFEEFERQVKSESDALRVVTIFEETLNGVSDDSIRNRIQGVLDDNTDRFVEASTRVGMMIDGMQGDDYARALQIAGGLELDRDKYRKILGSRLKPSVVVEILSQEQAKDAGINPEAWDRLFADIPEKPIGQQGLLFKV